MEKMLDIYKSLADNKKLGKGLRCNTIPVGHMWGSIIRIDDSRKSFGRPIGKLSRRSKRRLYAAKEGPKLNKNGHRNNPTS